MVGFGSEGGVGAVAAAGVVDGEQLWRQLQWEMTLGNCEEWEEAGALRKGFRKVREKGDVRYMSADEYKRSMFLL